MLFKLAFTFALTGLVLTWLFGALAHLDNKRAPAWRKVMVVGLTNIIVGVVLMFAYALIQIWS